MHAGPTTRLLLSLAGTPVLLFISPSITVYLSSQAELNHDLGVINPFVFAALVVFTLTSACYLVAEVLSAYRDWWVFKWHWS